MVLLWLIKLKLIAKSILLALIVLILFPPIFLFRYFVNKLSVLLISDSDCMVRPSDYSFLKDYERWHIEPDHTVLASNILDAGVTLGEIRSRYEKAVWKRSNHKLHQRIEKWMGYMFWRNDPGFHLEDHVKLYEDEEKSSNEIRDEKWLTKTKQKLLKKPYLKDKSPWEILLVTNVKCDLDADKEFCVIFWRLHHSLGDGISLRGISMELLDEIPPTIEPKFPPSNKSSLRRFLEGLTFVLQAPYIFLKHAETLSDENKSPWNTEGFNFSRMSNSAKSRHIHLPFLKDIKNKYKVSLNSVILLGISSILRRAFIKLKTKLPDAVHCIFPIPLPNHPDELCHHAMIIPFGFPIGIADPEERLSKIEQNLRELKDSFLPYTIFLAALIFGHLPYIFLKIPLKFILTGSISIFPGAAEQKPKMLGKNYYRESFCLGFYSPASCTGLFITCFTNNTTLDIDAHFERNIFHSDSEVEELYDSLYEDYRQLSSNSDNLFSLVNK